MSSHALGNNLRIPGTAIAIATLAYLSSGAALQGQQAPINFGGPNALVIGQQGATSNGLPDGTPPTAAQQSTAQADPANGSAARGNAVPATGNGLSQAAAVQGNDPSAVALNDQPDSQPRAAPASPTLGGNPATGAGNTTAGTVSEIRPLPNGNRDHVFIDLSGATHHFVRKPDGTLLNAWVDAAGSAPPSLNVGPTGPTLRGDTATTTGRGKANIPGTENEIHSFPYPNSDYDDVFIDTIGAKHHFLRHWDDTLVNAWVEPPHSLLPPAPP